MDLAVNYPNIPLIFTPKFREFGMRILDGGTSSFLGLSSARGVARICPLVCATIGSTNWSNLE
jgi:hypothetical protein